MLYLHGNPETIPIYEGIDKIKLTLQPHLYSYLDHSRIFKTINNGNEQWYNTKNKYLDIYVKFAKYRFFIYFIIHGEYIDIKKNIKEVIIEALFEIIQNNLLMLNNYLKSKYKKLENDTNIPKHVFTISRSFICDNPHLLIQRIKEMELYFDLNGDSIRIGEHRHIFNSDSPSFHDELHNFHKSKEYRKESAFIRKNGTIYSKDYHYRRRPSTVKIYNRKEKLQKNRNSYTEDRIMNYPNDTRFEILITNVNSGNRLNIENLNGTYSEVINKYMPLLEVYFCKFVFPLCFSNISHLKYLPMIYKNSIKYPHKKYNGYELTTFKLKYPDKNQICLNGICFQEILNKEYTKLKRNYITNIRWLMSFMKKDIRMDLDNACYYTIFDKYIDSNDDNVLVIGEEYMPIRYNQFNYKNL